jgi:hypothetical protein
MRAFVVALALLSACKTVSREPVAFASESYHAQNNEEYEFLGWVSGESCEEWYITFLSDGTERAYRTGDRERPRRMSTAFKNALNQKSGAIFIADVMIENEYRQDCLSPLKVCTVVTGAAMGSSTIKRNAVPRADPPPKPPKPLPPPVNEDAPSRVITPKD